jgi:hypothetical protein
MRIGQNQSMAKPNDHHFTIRGVRVLWRYARLRGRAAGWAIWPDAKNPDLTPKVLIDSSLLKRPGRALLETELHEGLHQCLPDLSEETVTVVARDLSRIIFSLGWRRERRDK